MNKAILVIDEMPTTCIDCVGCYSSDKMYLNSYTYKQLYKCQFMGCINELSEKYSNGDICYLEDPIHSKPDWCPLKEAPEKYEQKYWEYPDDEYFADGYNKCVDDILES